MDSKSITFENHLLRDPRLDPWTQFGISSKYTQSTEYWVKQILSKQICANLPEYVADMFDRARSCMVYGCYYYPLFTLGFEELYRVKEAAFREAVLLAGAPKNTVRGTYERMQTWAKEANLIDEAEANRWQASRSLRNAYSHKMSRTLVGPNDAISNLDTTVELIEKLYRNCSQIASSTKE